MYQSLSQREWGLFLRVFDNNPREEEIPHAAGSHWKHRESLQGGQDFSLMPGKDTIAPMPASTPQSAPGTRGSAVGARLHPFAMGTRLVPWPGTLPTHLG